MPGTFSPPPQVSDPDMHHGTYVKHMPRSLTSGFIWSRWRGKRSRHSWRMRNPQFYVSGKRPIAPWMDEVSSHHSHTKSRCGISKHVFATVLTNKCSKRFIIRFRIFISDWKLRCWDSWDSLCFKGTTLAFFSYLNKTSPPLLNY